MWQSFKTDVSTLKQPKLGNAIKLLKPCRRVEKSCKSRKKYATNYILLHYQLKYKFSLLHTLPVSNVSTENQVWQIVDSEKSITKHVVIYYIA